METAGRAKSSEPVVKGGTEASGGEVRGTGTKPAATLPATSDPAVPPIAFPISVSRPAALYTGPRPPEKRLIGEGSPTVQSKTVQTGMQNGKKQSPARSAAIATAFWKSFVQCRLI